MRTSKNCTMAFVLTIVGRGALYGIRRGKGYLGGDHIRGSTSVAAEKAWVTSAGVLQGLTAWGVYGGGGSLHEQRMRVEKGMIMKNVALSGV